MNVTIKQLTYFREVARCGSFTDAANQLHTSQSNLSSSIRVLEELLGVRLINRTTKHFELTESGEAFLDVAERVLDDLENAVQKASALSKLERGVLSIAAPRSEERRVGKGRGCSWDEPLRMQDLVGA